MCRDFIVHQSVAFLNLWNWQRQKVDSCHPLMFGFMCSSCSVVFTSTRAWWATPRVMCARCVGVPWALLAPLDGIFSSTRRTASPTALSVVHASQTPTTLTGSSLLFLWCQAIDADWREVGFKMFFEWTTLIDSPIPTFLHLCAWVLFFIRIKQCKF